MNYVNNGSVSLSEILDNLEDACAQTNLECATLLELQGQAIRTQALYHEGQKFDSDQSLKIKADQVIRISDNKDLIEQLEGSTELKDLLILSHPGKDLAKNL